MHELEALIETYLRWRRAAWPLERWAADALIGITVLAIIFWVTR
jgi:hypothetical protein